jgi:undecaprenyl-diphosphatase
VSTLDAIWLGLVQGLTEFLPVSSSGHLVLAEQILGVEASEDVSFEVIAHLGTLLAVILVFRRPLLAMIRCLPVFFRPGAWKDSFAADEAFRQAVLVVFATLPVVVVGLFFEDRVDALFATPRLVPLMLLITAMLLLGSAWLTRRAERAAAAGRQSAQDGRLTWGRALAMGLAQAMAIAPGISRSGATISLGLATGVERERAGAFSFLMSVPAVLGACVLKFDDIAAGSVALGSGLAALAASFLSGWAALVALMALVRRGRLWIFAPYLVVVAILGFIFIK